MGITLGIMSFYPSVIPGIGCLNITYTTHSSVVNRWVQTYFPDDLPNVMGMDAEWKSTSKHPTIALLQLSDYYGNVLLFHLKHYASKRLPTQLSRVLGSKMVYKVGVGVKGDALKLKHLFPDTKFDSVINIEHGLEMLHKVTTRRDGPSTKSLWRLSEYYLQISNWKDIEVTKSNWECSYLSRAQRDYSAMDAWASVAVFVHMCLPPHVLSLTIQSF